MSINRRNFIKSLAAAGSASLLTIPTTARAAGKGKVVVIGGGFGGSTAAKYIKMMDPAIEVTLIEANKTYTSCPLSNEVLSGHRDIASLQTGYAGAVKRGINVIHDHVASVDAAKKTVTTSGGQTLGYDALVMAPGIAFDYEAVAGYSKEASKLIPHAYKAGEQTLLLKAQLEAMPDGGLFIISVPPKPFRCPPGPYERAAQVASYMKHHGKAKSKVLILDANDSFSKKGLFEQGWKALYPGMIEWVSGANDGKVERVDAAAKMCFTGLNDHKADVINLIPPHRAGKIAQQTGLTNAQGWCEVVPMTMESTVHKDIYPIGDCCIAGELPVYDMPKSAHMAITQAKVAAGAIVAKLNGLANPQPWYVNTCFSTLAPDYGISVVHVYRVTNNQFVYVKEAGGISPIDAPPLQRKLEAEYCVGWFNNVMADAFA